MSISQNDIKIFGNLFVLEQQITIAATWRERAKVNP